MPHPPPKPRVRALMEQHPGFIPRAGPPGHSLAPDMDGLGCSIRGPRALFDSVDRAGTVIRCQRSARKSHSKSQREQTSGDTQLRQAIVQAGHKHSEPSPATSSDARDVTGGQGVAGWQSDVRRVSARPRIAVRIGISWPFGLKRAIQTA